MKRALAGITLIFSVAAGAKETDWRANAPKPGPEPKLPIPKIERADLPNGLAVLVHQRHDLPFVFLEAVLPAGDAAQPPGKEGLAALTVEMLQAGTKKRDAGKIADDAAALGVELLGDSEQDSAHLEMGTLATNLPQAVELLADTVVNSSFPAPELERARSRRLAQILERGDDPAEAVKDVLPAVAYGEGHPYAAPHFGTKESVAKLTRDDLLGFYKARYRPGGSAIIIVGDTTLAEAKALVEKSALGSWPALSAAPINPGMPQKAAPRGIVLVDKPGAPQSQVGFALLTVPGSHPDHTAIEAIEACLGGTFSSRLNLNLREQHGYTYGAFTRIHWFRGPSLFIARAGIRTDVTLPSLGELRNELRKMASDPPTDAEVALAKAQMVHGLTGQFETMRDAAGAIEELFILGLPLDYYQKYAAEVDALTRDQVKKAIEKHFKPEKATIVIIGDRSQIEPELLIQHRDSQGRVIR
jgi:zinc protease